MTSVTYDDCPQGRRRYDVLGVAMNTRFGYVRQGRAGRRGQIIGVPDQRWVTYVMNKIARYNGFAL